MGSVLSDLKGIDKLFYKTMLKDLFSDTCTVKFWDGEEVIYGEGDSKFKLILHEPIPKADIIADPSLAFGEAYMHQKLEVEGDIQKIIESLYHNLDSFLGKNNMSTKVAKKISNNIKKSKKNIQHHYDIGNEFYKLWLDDTMTYSCGYFESDDDTLTQAQKNKVNHILKKLNLKEGQTLLDIGCGWGELIISAARNHKVKAMGITLSSEQLSAVKKKIENAGLDDLLEVKLMDYRELKDRKFDRIVSVGMIEHVGKDRLHEYFSNINNLLNAGGLSLLHCITGIRNNEGGTNSWIDKYIFPGGYIPNYRELIGHMAKEEFYLLDVESLRRHYGRTLENWAKNFEQALPLIQKSKDEVFIRMWRLYLNACAASFNCGKLDIHQFLFSKNINNEIPWCRNYLYQS
ncbi:SAM-dependent methyltransferase [Desulfoscipio gibsoniae]|uniref:Methyltransferase, cyclopropane fatty acid synthase n=1 Tax=Desulfoscipio gibsoniae DSM 7213 TaxID=767817 RepID=R4KC38_9FIRM|nr:cyclopropane-fatty-acyl-phospholipid synthase family protein [Desulfoscipio gibsoniae]AGL00758.1 methyltransferase, cyclopropane fatty acid synthase [Desulfoscipio gibsoniae DSM 7213]